MIVFEDDRYYICKASTFSKDGNNRYSFGEFETIDDAKKRIDKYYADGSKEEESMKKTSYRRIKESCNEELETCDEKEEILNEEDDIPYPEKPNLLNLIDYYMDKYDMDYDNAVECARGDLEAMGKYTRYFDESVEIKLSDGNKADKKNIVEAVMHKYNISEEQARDGIKAKLYTVEEIQNAVTEVTNPSSIGQFKRSVIGSKSRTRSSKKIKEEDRIITKDDELNKPTNVKDDTQDKIEIDVTNDQNGTDTYSSNQNNQQTTTTSTVTTVTNDEEETNGDPEKIEERDSEMTEEEKDEWTKNASPEDLLSTYLSMNYHNSYGKYAKDIKKVYDEMIRRMSK